MKHFQDLGHRVIFLIGDFTGLIGDPTGRSKTRPPLDAEEIARERRDLQGAGLQDSRSRPRRSSTSTPAGSRRLAPKDSIRLAARYNVAQMLERRDFKQRFEARQADRGPRVSLSARAGVRLGVPGGRCRARRHRPAVQPERRPRHHAGLRPRGAGRDDDAAARGARRRREDVEEPRQLRRRDRAGRRDVRQADVDQRRADVAVLPAADRSEPEAEIDAAAAAGGRPARCIRSRPRWIWRRASSRDFHSAAAAAPARPRRSRRRFTRGEMVVDDAARGAMCSVARRLDRAGQAASSRPGWRRRRARPSRKIQQGGVQVDREKVTDIRAPDSTRRGSRRARGWPAGGAGQRLIRALPACTV